MRATPVGAALLVAYVSCRPPARGPDRDLVVALDAAPAAVRSGDSVAVRVTVTNRGRRARPFALDNCGRPFVVKSEAGAVVGPTPLVYVSACAPRLPRDLAPGASEFATAWWRVDVPPGTYTIEGRVTASAGSGASATVRVTP